MGKESIKYIMPFVLAFLVFGMMAGTAGASTQAGVGAQDVGYNVTINVSTATSSTGVPIIVTVNMTNITGYPIPITFYINATNVTGINVNGASTNSSTLSLFNGTNQTFWINSSAATDFFSVYVSNAINSSESAELTGFRFVNASNVLSPANSTATYNNGSIGTSVSTNVYYFFNGSYINITVATIAKMDNVTADFSGVGGGTVANSTGANISGIWYYNLTNVSITSADNTSVKLINITLSYNNLSMGNLTAPFVALMNFNPIYIDTSLGGTTTDWTTISDFTNVSGLTFEGMAGGISKGRIVFTSPINLTNQTTALALANLGTNLKVSQNNMSLNSAASALAALNVSASLTMNNLSLSGTPSIFSNGQLMVAQGSTGGGKVSGLSYDATTKTLTFNVGNWSDYTIFALTNESVSAVANSSSNFTMKVFGTPSMLVTIDSNRSGVDKVNGNVTPYNLTTDSTGVVTFNLTSSLGGTANITATNGTNITYNTNVTFIAYNFSLTNISTLGNTTTAGTNATYNINLTNSGSADSFTLTVLNPNSASVALLNISSFYLTNGSSQIITLDVTNNTAGIVYVNVTATSVNDSSRFRYINTTTTVTGSTYGANLTNISALSNTTTAGTNVTYLLNLNNNGSVNDSYTLTVQNPNHASVALLNISSLYMTNGSSQIITLNVTNDTAGILYVNVTATSVNDSSRFSYINTTTTVINATGSANGTVTDVRLGIPIANVTITLTNTTAGTYPTTTDSNGYYSISNMVTSTANAYIYTISASKAGYFTNASATVTVTNSSSINSTLNITLRAYNGTLKGTYIKSGTSIGINGASVNITNSTLGSVIVTTDTLGFYSVSVYPAIYDTVTVSKTGYSTNSTTNVNVNSNATTTVPTIPLSLNAVTVTADRTVGTASTGQNVSFNLTVINTGDDANLTVATSVTNASTNVTNTTTPSPFLLNTSNSTGSIVVTVNNSNFGGWPVTITISNSTQSKSASITLNAIMRNESASFTNISSTNDTTTTVTGATLVNATIENYANVSGNSTLISNATITGIGTSITDGAVIKGDYGDSNIDNSSVGNATVDSSNLTGSTIRDNASVTNSTLISATVDNSTLTNVTVSSTSTITNVSSLSNITLAGVTVTGDPSYDYEGSISSGTGWANYQTINFTKIYVQVRISQLVIEQSSGQDIGSNTNTSINDTSLGTSMNFSMTANLSSGMVINISETGISPDGAGFSSGTQLGNFLVIRSNDTNASNVTSNTLRLYFDTNPADFSGGVAIYYYNTSVPGWEALTTTAFGTEGGRYYREVVVRHFSTFALLGTTSTGGGNTGGSSGGSTGGGGIVTPEPFDNIAKSESYDKDLIADSPVTYTFKAPELAVYEIAFTDKENENGITVRVEVLKGTSKQVTVQAPGTVYKNINILAGTKRMKEALVKFRVENSWLNSNNLAGSDVKMLHWDGSQWTQLETTQTTKDDTYTSFEAKTDALSPFAISGLKGGIIVPTATPAGAVTETPAVPTGTGTPAPSPTQKVPAFEFVLTVAILSAAYLFGRKRR